MLPYLAIALLALATLYSAIVSFRTKNKDAAPSWIFPRGTKRGVRISIALASIALIVGLAAYTTKDTHHETRPSSRFLIPEGFTGWVRIEFEVRGAPALPMEGGQYLLRIPPDGVLRTSSPEQYGWAKDSYFSYTSAGEKPLSDSGPGEMIWGKINGESSGAGGKTKYEEFFVGSEQQFKAQGGK